MPATPAQNARFGNFCFVWHVKPIEAQDGSHSLMLVWNTQMDSEWMKRWKAKGSKRKAKRRFSL
jgi:hypothetical protein